MPLDPRLFLQYSKDSNSAGLDKRTFSDLVNEALARDPEWTYGQVLPIAKNKKTGEYSPALPGMLRDYLGGWADLITGPQVGENLSPQAVLSILGPGAHAAAGSPSVVIGPGARAFNLTKAFKSPLNEADDILRNVIDDSAARLIEDKPIVYGKEYAMDDIFSHPELFQAYPQLRSMLLKFENLPGNIRGLFNKEKGISVSQNVSEKTATGVILHELQHAIQHVEGMNPGNNTYNFLPDDYSQVYTRLMLSKRTPTAENIKAELDKMKSDAIVDYMRTPGETEARAVQKQFLAQNPPNYAFPRRNQWASIEAAEPEYPNLPSPYNWLDIHPTNTREFNSANRQQYSPEIEAFAKMLGEYMRK